MNIKVVVVAALAVLAMPLPLSQLLPSPEGPATIPWFYDDMRPPENPPPGFVMPKIRSHEHGGVPDFSGWPDYTTMTVTDGQLEGPAGARTVYPIIRNITMSLSFAYEATVAEFQAMDGGLRRFANLVYDYTDGQFNINQFDIYNNQVNWNSADIHVLNLANYRANAQYGGIAYGGIIQVGRDAWGQSWDSAMGAIIFAHEFGHWGLFLPDEYDDHNPSVRCDNASAGTCIMSNPYNYYEICTDESHNSSTSGVSKSCWSFIKQYYPNAVEVHGAPDPGPSVGPGATVRWHYPDLYVVQGEMSIVPAEANEGQNLTISLPVHNPERLASGGVAVKFFLDSAQPSNLIGTVNVSATNVDSVTAKLTWRAVGGTHSVIGVVDPDGAVRDLNRNNNTASRTVTVNGRPVISSALGGFVSKEDVPITVRMTQFATDAEDSPAELKWSVVKFNNRHIASAGTGANQTLFFNPVLHWWGTTTVTVSVADTAGLAATKDVNLTFTFVNYAPETVDPSFSAPAVLRGRVVELSAAAIDVEDRSDMLTPRFEWRPPGSDRWVELGAYYDGSRHIANVTVPMSAAVGRADARIAFVDTGGLQGEWYYLNSSLSILNNKPAVTGLWLSAGTVVRGEPVELWFNASDPETLERDLRPAVEFRTADGEWRPLQAEIEYLAGTWVARIDVDASWATGSHDFRVLVNDTDGSESSWLADSDALTVLNSRPVLEHGKASRTRMLRNDTSTVTLSASDHETAAAGLVFEFRVRDLKGREQNSYMTAPELSGNLWVARFQPPHSALAGRFTISVRVGDADGGWSDWYEGIPAVEVGNNPPLAALWGPSSGMQGTSLWFDASNSSDPENHLDVMSFSWDFGDGTPAGTGVTTPHTFTRPGTYRVTLTLTDRDGAVSTAETTVTVTARPAPAQNAGAGWLGGLLPYVALIAAAAGAGGAFLVARRRRRPGQETSAPPEATPLAAAETSYEAVHEPEYVDPAGQPYPESAPGPGGPGPFPPPVPEPEPYPLRPADPDPGPWPHPEPDDERL